MQFVVLTVLLIVVSGFGLVMAAGDNGNGGNGHGENGNGGNGNGNGHANGNGNGNGERPLDPKCVEVDIPTCSPIPSFPARLDRLRGRNKCNKTVRPCCPYDIANVVDGACTEEFKLLESYMYKGVCCAVMCPHKLYYTKCSFQNQGCLQVVPVINYQCVPSAYETHKVTLLCPRKIKKVAPNKATKKAAAKKPAAKKGAKKIKVPKKTTRVVKIELRLPQCCQCTHCYNYKG